MEGHQAMVVAARHGALAGGRPVEVRELEGGVGPIGPLVAPSNKGLMHQLGRLLVEGPDRVIARHLRHGDRTERQREVLRLEPDKPPAEAQPG